MKRKLITLLTVAVLAVGTCFVVTGCGDSSSDDSDTAKITIVQQYGMAYAPLQIMEQKSLIESKYEELTGKSVEVEYTQLNSGSTINEAFASGDVQVGAMGLAPAITGTLSGVGYKISSAVSAQPHKIMTNDSSIKTLSDIGDEQIALVNVGSIQHIMLAMAAKEELGDAHALDENIAAMAHPDGMAALLNGSIKLHLTTSPYTFQEEDEGMTEVEGLESGWPEGNTFIVAVVSEELHDSNPELYQAINEALSESIDFINDNTDEAANILIDNGYVEDVDQETLVKWMTDAACSYSTELKGAMDMANFMDENDFLEVDGAESISDLTYDDVEGN